MDLASTDFHHSDIINAIWNLTQNTIGDRHPKSELEFNKKNLNRNAKKIIFLLMNQVNDTFRWPKDDGALAMEQWNMQHGIVDSFIGLYSSFI